ncbi:MAG TPA: hypothetical protein VHS32_17665, partial [Streptosporangiaceae bacterium]|nr:hypothetical protein [Streptosporangiaceae bacterium]
GATRAVGTHHELGPDLVSAHGGQDRACGVVPQAGQPRAELDLPAQGPQPLREQGLDEILRAQRWQFRAGLKRLSQGREAERDDG